MFISKRLSKELHRTEAKVLLFDGKDDDGKFRISMRDVDGSWGHWESSGNKGGIIFRALSDGSTHVRYSELLGYNTGSEASVQGLLLWKYNLWTGWETNEWHNHITEATRWLLDARPVSDPRLTVDYLTKTKYWYRDNWGSNLKCFVKLKDAKRHALTETGMSINIHSSQTGEIKCVVPASGNCPP